MLRDVELEPDVLVLDFPVAPENRVVAIQVL
jgi:hypothetical protein